MKDQKLQNFLNKHKISYLGFSLVIIYIIIFGIASIIDSRTGCAGSGYICFKNFAKYLVLLFPSGILLGNIFDFEKFFVLNIPYIQVLLPLLLLILNIITLYFIGWILEKIFTLKDSTPRKVAYVIAIFFIILLILNIFD